MELSFFVIYSGVKPFYIFQRKAAIELNQPPNELQVFKDFFEKLIDNPAIKIPAGFILWVLRFLFGPVFRAAYGAVAILFIVDFVTGYGYAWMDPEISPSSRKMFHGLIKLLIYAGLLFVGYQVSVVQFGALFQSTIEMMIVLTEAKSVLENLQKIAKLKGVDIPFLEALVTLVQGKLNEATKGAKKQ